LFRTFEDFLLNFCSNIILCEKNCHLLQFELEKTHNFLALLKEFLLDNVFEKELEKIHFL